MTVASPAEPMLRVRNLHTHFPTRGGTVHAVNGVSFDLQPGELLGVVGESGSGKSVTMMSLLGLLHGSAKVRADEARFEGIDLLNCPPDQLRDLRGGRIGFVFQDPMSSLNPVFTVGYQLCEPLRRHLGMSKEAARRRAAELLDLVGIAEPQRRLSDYPHQFSGGMRQRVMIAMALTCDPRLLIADEPTTALDVTIQAQILELVRKLRQQMGMAILWITHDLGVVASIADRAMVMYGGRVAETAPVQSLFSHPAHPYTQALLEALPRVRGPRPAQLRVIEGQPPLLMQPPRGCTFRDRCSRAMDECAKTLPEPTQLGHEHQAACLRAPSLATTEEGAHVH